MRRTSNWFVNVCAIAIFVIIANFATQAEADTDLVITGDASIFAPGIASTGAAEVRLTMSPDGKTALWFSRDRKGGPGGYDIWISRKAGATWSSAAPAPFNSTTRDFDPAFSSDGAFVYFCSDRAGTLGGDDVFRVAVTAQGFGVVEHLGPDVNSNGNEFAPMLSPDRSQLLFASDRAGGAGGHDLFVSHVEHGKFAKAQSLPGDINTRANEFDATFLSDGSTIVFARALDFRTDRVDLFFASLQGERYDSGTLLPSSVNSVGQDTYGPMLDWSTPNQITFSSQRAGSHSMDLYLVSYRLNRR